MSDVFDDTLKRSADSFFKLPGYERVVYRPSGGPARTIKAVVTRSDLETVPGVAVGGRPVFNVLLRNDETAGIDSETIDTGGDKIDLAPRVGERPVTFRITELLNHDAGLLLVMAQ